MIRTCMPTTVHSHSRALLRCLIAEQLAGADLDDAGRDAADADARDDDATVGAEPAAVPGASWRRELLLPPLFDLARSMAAWPDVRPDGRLSHAVFSGVPRGLPPREGDIGREVRRFERVVAHIHGDDEPGARALARRWAHDITRASAGVRRRGRWAWLKRVLLRRGVGASSRASA